LSLKDRILENTTIYRLWMAPFAEPKLAPILRGNELSNARRVLDIGCGPGTNTRYFLGCDYLGVDINESYVASARRRFGDRFMTADATTMVINPDQRFDFVLMNSLLHHLDDAQARRLLRQVAGFLTNDGCVHIIELVLPDNFSVPRFLARVDRGRYPRSLEGWKRMFDDAFESILVEPFSLTCLGVPLWKLVYFKGYARN
jgi:SAM-dependent methyltransferase